MNHNYNNVLGENYLVCSSKLQRVYMQICTNAVKDYSFTSCEIAILLFLDNNKPLDTAKDITEYRGISKGLVCKNVDSLINKGYLNSKVDETDKRYIHLSITEKADDILQKLRTARKSFFSQLFNNVSDEEIALLKSVPSIMMNNFDVK